MNEYLMRAINLKADTETLNSAISVSRSRASNGSCEIVISLGSQTIKVDNQPPQENNQHSFGEDYEKKIAKLVEMILEITADPCTLPEQK